MAVTASLWKGVVPSVWKKMVVHSLFSKPSLDPSVLDNFYSVSYLPFLDRIMEKVVDVQLLEAPEEVDYVDSFQSSFKPCYGMEIALDPEGLEIETEHPSLSF